MASFALEVVFRRRAGSLQNCICIIIMQLYKNKLLREVVWKPFLSLKMQEIDHLSTKYFGALKAKFKPQNKSQTCSECHRLDAPNSVNVH